MPTEKASVGFEETYREQRLSLLRFAYLLCGVKSCGVVYDGDSSLMVVKR